MLRDNRVLISLILFYLVLFLPFLGSVHLFDWDEINFAEAAREMLVTGDWLNVKINYEPFWEKPPLFIWLQAISMKLFGVNEFAARLPNVIIGLITLIIVFKILKFRFSEKVATLSILLYLGSYTSHFYFKSGIIDPLFNLFIFLSVFEIVRYIEKSAIKHFFLSGVYLGLAIITKGPAALLLVGLSGLVYQIIYRHNFYTIKGLFALFAGLLIAPGFYFGLQIVNNGFWFVQEFTFYQIDLFRYPIASHGQPFYYHIVILLIACFPLTVLALPSLFKDKTVSKSSVLVAFMKVLFWVVLIVFSLVTTKIVHYSSMCYLPLTILASVWIDKNRVLNTLQTWFLAVIGLVWVILFAIIGLFGIFPDFIYGSIGKYVEDSFIQAQIETRVDWSIVGVFLAIYLGYLIIVLIKKQSFKNLVFVLTNNVLILTLFLTSSVGSIEETVQGKWIEQLESYQGKDYAHFTLGFKSYAHYYYTHHNQIAELNEVKLKLLNEKGLASFYDLKQGDKLIFDSEVRNYVIENTNIPVSVSAKIDKFDEMRSFKQLKRVFIGNGYGVWERR